MAQFVIPNRPFAVEPITGLMIPDGIFEVAVGVQTINAHLLNSGANAANIQVYLESVSDPGIVITPATHIIPVAEGGVAHLLNWQADFTGASPGKHLVSFIVETGTTQHRIIKKIFVTKMVYNSVTSSFSITTPEGNLDVAFKEMIGPKNPDCCRGHSSPCVNCKSREVMTKVLHSIATLQHEDHNTRSLLYYLSRGFKGHDPKFVLCAPQVLISNLEAVISPTPPFKGQYGDLPFQDPWWKLPLAVVAFLLLVAAAIAEAVDGDGDLTAGAGGTHDLPSSTGGSCCSPTAEGGGSSYVAAGLLAAAATVATIAGASDVRDPFRKGQDHTAPDTESELTISEKLKLAFNYSDDIIPGKPFKVGIDFDYARTTTNKTYTYANSETNENIHLLDKYVIEAPDVVRAYKREPFVVTAQFYKADGTLFQNYQLFVQCFLVGPNGQLRKFSLEDNGLSFDKKANDGTYTGVIRFGEDDAGLWKYFVLAQDVNNADPNLEPEEAAQIIGGMILTDQLSITFEGGTCPLVPDGHVNVIA